MRLPTKVAKGLRAGLDAMQPKQGHKMLARAFLLAVLTAALFSQLSVLAETPREWHFDDVLEHTLPPDFVTGTFFDGRPAGDWKVIKVPDAMSPPHVLAQLRNKGAEHNYNLVLVQGINASNLDLSVSFHAVSGKADMGGGLIWRAKDDRNYYLARANPLEQNIRVYHVVHGVRKMLKNYDEIIDVRKWHRLHVMNQGCRVQVYYDEKKVFDLCDDTFKEGLIGLWTKSDAVTYFDDLRLKF